MRTFRGTSEPPANDNNNDVDSTSGLRRSQCPIKISGVLMGSQDSLDCQEEDHPVFQWERVRHRSSSVARNIEQDEPVVAAAKESFTSQQTPFGKIQQQQQRKGQFKFGARRTSSVNNFVQAIEAEKSNCCQKRWFTKPCHVNGSGSSKMENGAAMLLSSSVAERVVSERKEMSGSFYKGRRIAEDTNVWKNGAIEVDPSQVYYHDGKGTRASRESLVTANDDDTTSYCNGSALDKIKDAVSQTRFETGKLNGEKVVTENHHNDNNGSLVKVGIKILENADMSHRFTEGEERHVKKSSVVQQSDQRIDYLSQLSHSNESHDLRLSETINGSCHNAIDATDQSNAIQAGRKKNDENACSFKTEELSSYNDVNYEESTVDSIEASETLSISESLTSITTNEESSKETSDNWAAISKWKRMTTLDNSLSVNTTATKRERSKTIDFHDISPSVWTYNGQVAKYVQKIYIDGEKKKKNKMSSNNNNKEEDNNNDGSIGQGLGIILDKLRNIETKLDEIKTMEHGIWYPDTSNDFESSSNSNLPALGETPTRSVTDKSCNTSWKDELSQKDELSSQQDCHDDQQEEEDASECSDITLIVNEEDQEMLLEHLVNSPILSTTPINFEETISTTDTISTIKVEELVSITIPVETVKIIEITMTPVDMGEPILSTTPLVETATFVEIISSEDEEEEDRKRKARIEKMAQQMLLNDKRLNETNNNNKKINKGLDTLSEQSEEDNNNNDDEESTKQQRPVKMRSRRTRSASRDRSLAKIRYCWRCHQTGHESFDCEAQLHPGNWCPRCLESTHWEDDCWVNKREVFCTICTLPGHLPCVHQTNDFRQRKLVVETFGWLAFKDWFREPDFWSWWNVSGYTNVPLYKLMQHHS